MRHLHGEHSPPRRPPQLFHGGLRTRVQSVGKDPLERLEIRGRKSQEVRTVKTATRTFELLRAKYSLPAKHNAKGKRSLIKKRAGSGRSKSNGPSPQKLQRNEVIERGIPGFRAMSYRTKLTYYDVATISTGAGSAGTRVYSTNGLYDPDITGAGHQPMPFDQLMLSFEHYVTTSAKMVVTFKNTSTTNTMSCAISLSASATPVSAYGSLVENGILVRDRLGMYPYSDSVKTLSMPCSVGQFGDVRQLLDNPSYEGSVAANPVEQSYFHISCWNPDTVSSTDCICEIYIVYQAVFREPRKNSPSLETALKKLIIAEEKQRASGPATR